MFDTNVSISPAQNLQKKDLESISSPISSPTKTVSNKTNTLTKELINNSSSLPTSKKTIDNSFTVKSILILLLLSFGLLYEMDIQLLSFVSTIDDDNTLIMMNVTNKASYTFRHHHSRFSSSSLTKYYSSSVNKLSRLSSVPYKLPLCTSVTEVIVIREPSDFFSEVHLFIIAGLEELGYKVRYIERNHCFHYYPSPSPSPTPNNTGDYFINKPVPPCYEPGLITISTSMCLTKKDDPWPRHPIFVNLEVLEPEVNKWERTCLIPGYAERIWQAGPIWDYSYLNIDYLKRKNLTTKALYLPLRYYDGLLFAQDSKYSEREEVQRIYDVGFIGTYENSPRRKHIFDELRKHGLKVDPLFGWYGLHKDQRVRQAKIYLNIRFYQKNFETVRLFWLLSLGTFVINEADPELNKESIAEYNNTMVHVPYDKIVETVLKYLPLLDERKRIADQGYDWVRSITPGKIIGPLMEQSPVKGIPACRIEYDN